MKSLIIDDDVTLLEVNLESVETVTLPDVPDGRIIHIKNLTGHPIDIVQPQLQSFEAIVIQRSLTPSPTSEGVTE